MTFLLIPPLLKGSLVYRCGLTQAETVFLIFLFMLDHYTKNTKNSQKNLYFGMRLYARIYGFDR